MVLAGISAVVWNLSQTRQPALTVDGAPIVHTYDGENNVAYEWRRDSYIQQDEQKTAQAGGKTVGLSLEFDKNYVSPAIGSKVAGTVRLLVNGQRATTWPKGLAVDKWSNDDAPRVYLKVYGAYSWACPPLSDLATSGDSSFGGIKNYTDYCAPGLRYVDITKDAAPRLSSFVYSANASTVQDKHGNPMVTQLELTNGEAKFEFIYRSGRYAPYLEFEVFESLEQAVYTRKVLPFQDQISNSIDVPEVATTAGPIQYQMELGSQSVEAGKPQTLTVKVTSIDNATKQVNASPYQRVRLWAYPLAYYAHYQQVDRALFDWPWLTSGGLEKAGDWLGYEDQVITTKPDTKVVASNRQHKALIYPGNQYIELDLIDGVATAYFQYNGKARSVSPQLIFVAQPANFDFEQIFNEFIGTRTGTQPGAPQRPGGLNPGAASVRYADELPPRPDEPMAEDGTQVFDRANESTYPFLYVAWFSSDLIAKTSYATTSIPITGTDTVAAGTTAAIPQVPKTLIAFVALQVAQLVGGGLMTIVFLIRRRRQTAIRATERPTPIRPRRFTHRHLGLLGMTMAVGLMATTLVHASFNRPLVDLTQTPSEPIVKTLPAVAESIATEAGHKLVVEFATDKLNPYPGGVTRGKVRLVDDQNKTVSANGIVRLVSGFQATNAIDDKERTYPDYFGEIRGREIVTRNVIEQSIWELRQEKDYTYTNQILEDIKHDAQAVGEQAKDAGVGKGGEALYNAFSKYLEDWVDDITVPVEIKPANFAITPGCNVPNREVLVLRGFEASATCGMALVLHDGEAEFEYVNHTQQFGYVTFEAMATEVGQERLAIYNPANYQAIGGSITTSVMLDAQLIDNRWFSNFGWSQPTGSARNQTAYTSLPMPFGDYKDFPPSQYLSSNSTKLDYGYAVTAIPKGKGMTEIVITPKTLTGRANTKTPEHQARLQVSAGFSPTQITNTKNGSYTNRNADGEYMDPADELGQFYPAKLVTPGTGTLATELTFKLGDKPVRLMAQLTDDPNIVPYLRLNLTVWSAEGVPFELRFEDIQRKLAGARSVLTGSGYDLKAPSSSIYRTESPRTVTVNTAIPLSQITRTSWWPIPSQIGQLFVVGQWANGLLLLMLILMWIITSRHGKPKITT